MDVLARLREFANLAEAVSDTSLAKKAIELQREVLVVSEENIALRQDLIAVRKELERLQRFQELRRRLYFCDGAYWDATPGSEDGPFCTGCWDKNSQTIRLAFLPTGHGTCPVCKTTFMDVGPRHPDW